jgi:chromosome segregation ATPase
MRWLSVVLIFAVTLLGSEHGLAQDKDRQAAREREIMRRAQEAQAAKQKLESEKALVEQEKAKIETELKDIKDKASKNSGAVAKEKRRANDLQAKLSKSTTDIATLTEDKQVLLSRVKELETKLAEQIAETKTTQGTLAEREGELSKLRDFSAKQTAANDSSEDKNRQLYALSRELIDKYRNQGLWESVRRAEPFTQARQVEVENLLEKYRDRADTLRAAPAPRKP